MYSSEISNKYNSMIFFARGSIFHLFITVITVSFCNVPGMVLVAGETKISEGHGPQSQAIDREVRTDLYRKK